MIEAHLLKKPMQAIEFNTTVNNGTVAIPAQYSSIWEGKAIRVIVLEDNQAQQAAELKPNNTPLLARLREIKIEGPPDFSENLDAYLNGEKIV